MKNNLLRQYKLAFVVGIMSLFSLSIIECANILFLQPYYTFNSIFERALFVSYSLSVYFSMAIILVPIQAVISAGVNRLGDYFSSIKIAKGIERNDFAFYILIYGIMLICIYFVGYGIGKPYILQDHISKGVLEYYIKSIALSYAIVTGIAILIFYLLTAMFFYLSKKHLVKIRTEVIILAVYFLFIFCLFFLLNHYILPDVPSALTKQGIIFRYIFLLAFTGVAIGLLLSIEGFKKWAATVSSSNIFKVTFLALVLLIPFSLFAMDINYNVKAIAFNHPKIEKFFLFTVKQILDFDRDNYSAILGGGDPDDFNSNIISEAALRINKSNADKRERVLTKDDSISQVSAPYNVILITVSSLRADRLGCYGYTMGITPNLDKFANENIIFENAYSASHNSATSNLSILTSSYLSQLGSGKNYTHFAEVFKKTGALTFAIPSSLSWKLSRYLPRMNIDFYDNFDFYYDPLFHKRALFEFRSSDNITTLAEQILLLRKEGKFFLWLHYTDPHQFYVSNKDISAIRNIEEAYDSEVSFLDEEIGRFLGFLKRKDLWNDTVIVFTSDHGEALNERGWSGHGHQLYNELIAVPLIMKVPGISARVITEPVSGIDILPTLMDVLKITAKANLAGESRAYLIKGEGDKGIPVFSEGYQDYAVIKGRWKLIHNYRNNTFELYNLESDKKERGNLADTEVAKVDEMKKILIEWRRRIR